MSPDDAFRFDEAALGITLLVAIKTMFERLPPTWRDRISIVVGTIAVGLLAGAYLEQSDQVTPVGLLAVCTAALFFWMCWKVRRRRPDRS